MGTSLRSCHLALEGVWKTEWLKLKGNQPAGQPRRSRDVSSLVPSYKCQQHHLWETVPVNLQTLHQCLGWGVGSEGALDGRRTDPTGV